MYATYRTLLVCNNSESRELLEDLAAGSEILIEEAVTYDVVVASVAQRPPDLIVIDLRSRTRLEEFSTLCVALKANPATALLPLFAICAAPEECALAIEAGVDECLTERTHAREFQMRVRSLLRASAAHRRLAAEELAAEVRRGEEVRATFRRYVSPKLVDHILGADPRTSIVDSTRTRLHAAVLFADMRGFTRLSESLPPTAVVELLNEWLGLMAPIVNEYDGTIFNLAGDSLLVGFGVPLPQAEETARAVLAGRAMLERFETLAGRWQGRHGVETGLGIGIHAGEVVVGNIGSPIYMNFTIIGDTVNVASRLGQRARAGELLFSDAVRHSMAERVADVDVISLPRLQLRGRLTPLDIFCIPTPRDRLDLRTH